MAEANNEQCTYERMTLRELFDAARKDLKNSTDSEFESEGNGSNHSKVEVFPCN